MTRVTRTPAMTSLDLDAALTEGVSDPAAADDEQACVAAGLLIRRLRLKQKLTQKELADRVGMAQPNLSELERGGGTHGPTLTTLMRIARACGEKLLVVPASELAELREVQALVNERSRRVKPVVRLEPGRASFEKKDEVWHVMQAKGDMPGASGASAASKVLRSKSSSSGAKPLISKRAK